MLKYFRFYNEPKHLHLRTSTGKYPILKFIPVPLMGKEELHVKVKGTGKKKVITVYTIVVKGNGHRKGIGKLFGMRHLVTVGVVTSLKEDNVCDIVNEIYALEPRIVDLATVVDEISDKSGEEYQLNGCEINPSLRSTVNIKSCLGREEIKGNVSIEK